VPPVTRLPIDAAMGRYQQELVRWNRQINLVSRKGTLSLVATLIRQCRDAFSVLREDELADSKTDMPFWYFDLGSGGGLPGYVWHHELSLSFGRLRTWLVEPREKRAWFLGRLNRIAPESPICVLEGLWGETAVQVAELDNPGTILVSLKALRLSDEDVLSGLAAVVGPLGPLGGCLVVIARFYPPGQNWDEALWAELSPLSGAAQLGGVDFVPAGQVVLAPKKENPSAASLVISRYKIRP